MTALAAERATQRKTKVGRVVSDKMDKTIVVSVERLSRHPLYKRVIRLTTKFKAHDEANEAHLGDTVLIEESRPLSATKRWRLIEIVARASEHAGEALPFGRARDPRFDHGPPAHPGRDAAGPMRRGTPTAPQPTAETSATVGLPSRKRRPRDPAPPPA